jgi:hypothetical protein
MKNLGYVWLLWANGSILVGVYADRFAVHEAATDYRSHAREGDLVVTREEVKG